MDFDFETFDEMVKRLGAANRAYASGRITERELIKQRQSVEDTIFHMLTRESYR